MHDWVAVAQLLRPQGRRGELLAEPLSGQKEIFAPGVELRLVPPPGSALPSSFHRLESAWQPQGRKAGRLVLKLAGCDSINDAEKLEGAELQLRKEALPALAEDTFLVRDLLGCMLWNGDQPVGTVVDLQFPIAADGRTRLQDSPDLLVIDPLPQSNVTESPEHEDGGDTAEGFLVPFVKAWLDEVDLPGKRLRMHLPPGLID